MRDIDNMNIIELLEYLTELLNNKYKEQWIYAPLQDIPLLHKHWKYNVLGLLALGGDRTFTTVINQLQVLT